MMQHKKITFFPSCTQSFHAESEKKKKNPIFLISLSFVGDADKRKHKFYGNCQRELFLPSRMTFVTRDQTRTEDGESKLVTNSRIIINYSFTTSAFLSASLTAMNLSTSTSPKCETNAKCATDYVIFLICGSARTLLSFDKWKVCLPCVISLVLCSQRKMIIM